MHVRAMLARTRPKRRIPRLRGAARRAARKVNRNRASVASIARRHASRR